MPDSPAFYEERIRLLQAENQSHDSMIDAYRREVATQTERAGKAEAETQRLRDALERINEYPYLDSVPAARGMRVMARAALDRPTTVTT